jgi:hypothetical protein
VKEEFTLQFSNGAPTAWAEIVNQPTKQAPVRVFFRLNVPEQPCTAQLFWREHSLGQVELPTMTAQAYVQGLTLETASLQTTIGTRTVSCQSIVSAQAKAIFASALLRASSPLAPARDLDLRIQVERSRGQAVGAIPIELTGDQRRARQALVTVQLPKLRWVDDYRVSWHVASRCLHALPLRVVSKKTHLRSLRVSTTRFVMTHADGKVETLRTLPRLDGKLALDGIDSITPVFFVCSSEPGMAGLAPFTLRALIDETPTTLAIEEDVLITDGPTPIMLGSVPAGDAPKITQFTLSCGDANLGNLPLVPAPKADFNAEGGFAGFDDFLWSAAAEEQLNERLGKLLDGG